MYMTFSIPFHICSMTLTYINDNKHKSKFEEYRRDFSAYFQSKSTSYKYHYTLRKPQTEQA